MKKKFPVLIKRLKAIKQVLNKVSKKVRRITGSALLGAAINGVFAFLNKTTSVLKRKSVQEYWQFCTMILTMGGAIALVIDYKSDHKMDGRIRL